MTTSDKEQETVQMRTTLATLSLLAGVITATGLTNLAGVVAPGSVWAQLAWTGASWLTGCAVLAAGLAGVIAGVQARGGR